MLGQVNEVQGKVLRLFAPLSPQVSGISLNCAASDRERDDYSNEKIVIPTLFHVSQVLWFLAWLP